MNRCLRAMLIQFDDMVPIPKICRFREMDREYTIPQRVRNSEADPVFGGARLKDIKAVHPASLVIPEFEHEDVCFTGVLQSCGESQILFRDCLTRLQTTKQSEKE